MALEHRAYDEKRSFIRMKINTPVQVQLGGEHFTARCKDLSGSGMLLQSDRELALGAQVEVHIDQEGENRLPFNASAQVVRVDAVNPSGYILGLSIKAIHD